MLFHQVINIGAYILTLDEKPVEPKEAKIVLTGTEDRLVNVGMNLQFRLRDLTVIIGSMLKRSTEISEEMVEWFLESLPLNRTIDTAMNLNKDIFNRIEDQYYKCSNIDQFLKIKTNNRDMYPTLLNLDSYELVGLDVVGEKVEEEDEDMESVFSDSDSVGDGYISLAEYIGIVSRLLFTQIGSGIKAGVIDLFSARR